MSSEYSILLSCSQAVRKKPYPDRSSYFPYLNQCPGCSLSSGKFPFTNRKEFCFLIFQFQIYWLDFKHRSCFLLSMYVYRMLLPSETDDSRFNSCENHILTDSIQPYNKRSSDLACSVRTVKYIRRSVNKLLLFKIQCIKYIFQYILNIEYCCYDKTTSSRCRPVLERTYPTWYKMYSTKYWQQWWRDGATSPSNPCRYCE